MDITQVLIVIFRCKYPSIQLFYVVPEYPDIENTGNTCQYTTRVSIYVCNILFNTHEFIIK